LVFGELQIPDILRRWFSDTRPIDWLIVLMDCLAILVDFLVLAAILVLELPEWRHKRLADRSARALAPFLHSGRVLQSSVPYQEINMGTAMMNWVAQVESWTSATQALLAGLSPRASFAFTHIVNAGHADREVRRPDGSAFHLSGYFGDVYQVLQVKLNNLQKIAENPQAYF
jgi:hypothetical protein